MRDILGPDFNGVVRFIPKRWSCEPKRKARMNYFCWELYNGKWSPKLYFREKPEGARAKGVSKSDPVTRSSIYEVDAKLSLDECLKLHPAPLQSTN